MKSDTTVHLSNFFYRLCRLFPPHTSLDVDVNVCSSALVSVAIFRWWICPVFPLATVYSPFSLLSKPLFLSLSCLATLSLLLISISTWCRTHSVHLSIINSKDQNYAVDSRIMICDFLQYLNKILERCVIKTWWNHFLLSLFKTLKSHVNLASPWRLTMCVWQSSRFIWPHGRSGNVVDEPGIKADSVGFQS